MLQLLWWLCRFIVQVLTVEADKCYSKVGVATAAGNAIILKSSEKAPLGVSHICLANET